MAKLKVPKKVGGLKVPKELRKQAKKALKFTESPAVRELAVAGLTLAAERMIAGSRAGGKARDAGAELLDAARRQGGKNLLASLNLGEVVRAATVEGARRFLEGFEQGAAAASEDRPKRRKTKASSAGGSRGARGRP